MFDANTKPMDVYLYYRGKFGQQYAALLYPGCAAQCGDPAYRSPISNAYTTEPSDASGFTGEVDILVLGA